MITCPHQSWILGLVVAWWEGRNLGLCRARRGSEGQRHTLFELSFGRIRPVVLPASLCPSHISSQATYQDCWLADIFSCSNSYIYTYGPFSLLRTRIGPGKIPFFFLRFSYFIFLTALGLHCCTQAFSSCSEWELLFLVEHRLWANGFQ